MTMPNLRNICECPECGRTHWQLSPTRPPGSELTSLQSRLDAAEAERDAILSVTARPDLVHEAQFQKLRGDALERKLATSEAARERLRREAEFLIEEIVDREGREGMTDYDFAEQIIALAHRTRDSIRAALASAPAKPSASEAAEMSAIAAEYDLNPVRDFLAERAPAPSRDAVLEESELAVYRQKDVLLNPIAQDALDRAAAAIRALKQGGQG